MTWEAVLASLHLLAVLTLVVFGASKAALCRTEWMNPAVVRRLAKLSQIEMTVGVALLLTGMARVVWGVKGVEWYVSQPLLHLKVLLVVVMAMLWIRPHWVIRSWLTTLNVAGTLPPAPSVQLTRRWIMRQAHLIPVIAVVAVFGVRGM